MTGEPPFRTFEVSDDALAPEKTAFITIFSEALNGRGDILVYNNKPTTNNVPVIYLLHGVFSSHWAWMFSGGAHQVYEQIRQNVDLPEFVLVMPSDGLYGDGSGYVNRDCGRFRDWIVEDVPRAVGHIVPEISSHSNHYIAGLSMGGYGALRIGAQHSDFYRGMAAHSPITKPQDFDFFTDQNPVQNTHDSEGLLSLGELLSGQSNLPPFRFDCGDEDVLSDANRQLHQFLKQQNIQHDYQEFPGGHDWVYWNRYLVKTLLFFANIEKSNFLQEISP